MSPAKERTHIAELHMVGKSVIAYAISARGRHGPAAEMLFREKVGGTRVVGRSAGAGAGWTRIAIGMRALLFQ
jgi:hypothetical protein